jgi:hypothetical protein
MGDAFLVEFFNALDAVRCAYDIPELEAHYADERGPDAVYIAGVCLFIGEKDKAFGWLERSYSRKEFQLPGITSDPYFDEIRTDPRYFDLVKRLGLA